MTIRADNQSMTDDPERRASDHPLSVDEARMARLAFYMGHRECEDVEVRQDHRSLVLVLHCREHNDLRSFHLREG